MKTAFKLSGITLLAFFSVANLRSVSQFSASPTEGSSLVKTADAYVLPPNYEDKEEDKGHVTHTYYSDGTLCQEDYDITTINCYGMGSIQCTPDGGARTNWQVTCVPWIGAS